MHRPSLLTFPGLPSLHPGRRWAGRPRGDRPRTRRALGDGLLLAGALVAVVGVAVYCVASLSGALDADLVAVALEGAVPAARLGLLVMGAGTLLWLAGVFLRLGASLDAGSGRQRER